MTTAFVRAANPIWYFPDLEGLPLNDEYYIFFLSNVFPYVPQAVFHDVDGTILWNNPLEFYPNGTLPDNLYFNDSQVYRLEIRHGNSQTDPLIYEINDFIPGDGGGSVVTSEAGFTSNQITNGQFSQISFNGTRTITVAGTYEMAPGWFLSLSGAGTTVLTQQVLVADQDQINNPPFALSINNTGWSSADLYQRFDHNGAIWSSNAEQDGFISMSVTARAIGSNYDPLSLIYKSSDGVEQVVATGEITTGGYQVLDGTILLPVSVNPQSSAVAYVDMILRLKPTGQIYLTNVQAVGQALPIGSETPEPPVYKQETIERQIDHLFHYYKDSILLQPKESLLVGWNFALNPWQFRTTAQTNVANNTYTADQTILVQQAYVASATANNVSVGQGTASENYAFKVAAVTATNKVALIQYIDPRTIAPYWTKKLSSLVDMYMYSPTHNTEVKFKMRLIYRASLPSTISQTEPIASWSNTDGSTPSFGAGWTEILPLNDPEYTANANEFNTFAFDQFQLPAADVGGNSTLAIVLYMTTNMVQTATADQVFFNSVSLAHNDFAIETQAETWDESLRKCQYYYEKSYDNATLPGASTVIGSLNKYATAVFSNGSGAGNCFAAPFEFEFSSVKRAIPTMTFYSTVGTVNNVSSQTFRDGVASVLSDVVLATYWTSSGTSRKLAQYITVATPVPPGDVIATAAPADNLSCSIRFHYVADARLGI